MNLQHLHLNLRALPEGTSKEVEVIVFLISQDLKSLKLSNTLAEIGCDGSFCIADVSELVFAFAGFEDRTDTLLNFYFGLLNRYCKNVSHENPSATKEAWRVYEELIGWKAKEI